jgi:hypothetical protein
MAAQDTLAVVREGTTRTPIKMWEPVLAMVEPASTIRHQENMTIVGAMRALVVARGIHSADQVVVTVPTTRRAFMEVARQVGIIVLPLPLVQVGDTELMV